jgi:hypothetical protein
MIIKITTLIASALSLIFSILFWSQLGNGNLQWMLALFAVVLESTKWLAWNRCRQSYTQKRWGSLLVSGGLFFLLILISISGTSLQIHQSYADQKSTRMKESTQYQILGEQIKQKQEQIQTLIENAKHDTEHGFRGRAQNVLQAHVPKAQAELDILFQAQEAHVKAQSTSLEALSTGISQAHSGNIELILCFVLGALLDTVLSFLFWVQSTCSKHIVIQKKNLAPKKLINKKIHRCAVTAFPKPKEYEEVKNLLKTKRCAPAVRAIKEIARVGTKRAQDYLNLLEEEGFLVRKNSRYLLSHCS